MFRLKVLIRWLVSEVKFQSGCEAVVTMVGALPVVWGLEWWLVMWVMSRLSRYWRQSRPTLADNSQARRPDTEITPCVFLYLLDWSDPANWGKISNKGPGNVLNTTLNPGQSSHRNNKADDKVPMVLFFYIAALTPHHSHNTQINLCNDTWSSKKLNLMTVLVTSWYDNKMESKFIVNLTIYSFYFMIQGHLQVRNSHINEDWATFWHLPSFYKLLKVQKSLNLYPFK